MSAAKAGQPERIVWSTVPAPRSARSAVPSRTCRPTSSVPPRPGARWSGRVAPDAIREVVMGCIGQVGPDAYNARRVALTAGLPAYDPGVHRQPAVRLRSAGHVVGGDGAALETG